MKIQSMSKALGRNFEYDRILFREIECDLRGRNSKAMVHHNLLLNKEMEIRNGCDNFFLKNSSVAEIIF